MTQCYRQLTFDFYHDKDLTADFKGGQITSDTGLLPVREMEEKLGWLTGAASVLSDPRDPDKTTHKLLPLLRQRVFGVIGGYEDCNDHDRMRDDPVLKLTAHATPTGGPLASQPTLSRFENWTSARDVVWLNRLLVEQYIKLHRDDPPEQITLDIDPTDDPCHGHQQLALFHGFYEQRMYQPLLVFERSTGMLLGVRLRAGNVSGDHRLLQLLRPIVDALKEAFPRAQIVVRGDAGLAGPRLYDYCENSDLRYAIGIQAYPPFKKHTDFQVRRMEERHERTGRPARHYSSLWHEADSWPHKRRVMYKVEVDSEGSSRRFVVTNMKGLPIHLYRFYSDRGTCETFIDELKNALDADRLSCRRFVANAFRLVMFALAHNLLRVYRTTLRGTPLEGASIETIRSRFLKVGARVRETVRRVWVHIATGFPYREVLAVVMERIRAMPSQAAHTAMPNAPPAMA
jgi:hypothetical protein